MGIIERPFKGLILRNITRASPMLVSKVIWIKARRLITQNS